MTVSLKGFFVRIPCAVPLDLVQACNLPFTPQEAIGFLKGAKERLITYVRVNDDLTVVKSMPKDHICKSHFGVVGHVAPIFPLKQRVMKQIHVDTRPMERTIAELIDRKIDEITRTSVVPPRDLQSERAVAEPADRKINEISRIIVAPPRDVLSERIRDWLLCQHIAALRSLAEYPANILIFQQIGIQIPEKMTNRMAIALLKTMQAFEREGRIVQKAKQIIKTFFFTAFSQNMPDTMLNGIQNLYQVPGAVDAMRRLSISMPVSITRQNVGPLMHEIDNWCEEGSEAAVQLERIVKPYFDFLIVTAL
jgi:hypothetical protein